MFTFADMHNQLYMQRCLELAALGLGKVQSNPLVGCVVTHEGKIIGEGFHQKFGAEHAEVNAIQSVINAFPHSFQQLLKEATVYVNLEPCAHFGKTPPCADLLVRHQVKNVVIANSDPNPEVNGKGIERLKAAGISVTTGVLEAEAAFLNRRFFTRMLQKRPYIVLKWAQTANGYFAPISGKSQKWISGSEAKKWVHKWRSEEDAVLIGSGTALADNPSLTVREWPGRNPVRIAIDRKLKIDRHANLYNAEAKTIIFNDLLTQVEDNIHFIQVENLDYYLPEKIMYQLYLMDIQSVIIEGGAHTLNRFIAANLWDEARVFTSSDSWPEGIPAPALLSAQPKQKFQTGTDELAIYYHSK